ncbi:hypothetical protein ABZ871_35330 [Streptomyces populi]
MSGDTGGGRPDPKGLKRPRPLKQARVGWPPTLRKLKELLHQVYLAADAPSLDAIAEDIADDDGLAGSPGRDTVHRVITDGERSGRQADVVAVATVLARRARWDAPDLAGRVRELWMQAGTAQGAGRPIGDLRGDVRLVLDGGLGVHPALDTGGARDRFGILPAYVPRDHDARLKAVVDVAKAGRSGIAVLVGGSSTGKTRALWEAVGELPDSWRLWHPLSPTAPDAVLDSLPDIAPKTVVWLNEAQRYLGADPLGEQVAAGLRELLNDPSRGPVLVLGTLWPEHWDTLTTRTRHAGARELLGGHKIDVPDAFTTADLAALDATDPRLAQAARHAKGAQITQYLAGVPYLMDRYRAARGATLALIHAAMDARRLGAGLHLPLDWLADAAPGYLDDDEYRTLDRNWLTQALDYVTEPCNGIPGILTLVTHSSPRNQRTRRKHAPSPQGPHYLLADYLDQHGRQRRAETIPPIDFWTAAAHHIYPADLSALGRAAWDRGLYRDAAQLHKHATSHGDPHAATTLVRYFHALHPTDHDPALWVAAHVALDDPYAVARLLQALREAGADEQVTALLNRDPATHVPLDNPNAVAQLLQALRKAGADEQITTLLNRDPATHATLDNPIAVTRLLQTLQTAGADEQITTLAERAAAHTTLDNPIAVTRLLQTLQTAGADEQITALAERAVAHTPLDDLAAVIWLLPALREAGADEQVTALLNRDPATHVPLDNPNAVVWLLQALRKAGAQEQVSTLLNRDPATHVPLDNPNAVVWLLQVLGEAGAQEQVTALLNRDSATHATLDNPNAVAELLQTLRVAGADEQITALAERAAAHTSLDDPNAVAEFLQALGEAGADEQVTALLNRDPATHATLDNPYAVARLLQTLRVAGADEQVTALLARDPATHATLDDPVAVAGLLHTLREAGAAQQVTALAERLPAAGLFDLFLSLGENREQFRLGREPDGSAAPSWTWEDLD